ncbi:TPA: AAA family ATPase [Salmonella enterica]|uniref:AAA family ATPase n=1 Tax=Salmonella enterica TaxID=28901 RepID=A0A742R3X6_SALER|nr:AAA family ATPase [Salmonella enterica]EEJ0843046.1 AAA family ATPase [Salmonella enterica]EGA1311560.1 AAA family ATPase [Salmonella enterica]EGA6694173.1 AAA family ATPase [Salmonella enterica]EGH1710796.1 AAA family ATPase [Salmonella enterica]
MEIRYSTGQHTRDDRPVPAVCESFSRFSYTLEDLRRAIGITLGDTRAQMRAKKMGLPYIWHSMKDVAGGRNALNAGDRDALFLDMDGCDAAAWQALRKVLAFFSCFTWSTPSHLHPTANGEQRWRICMELDRTVTPEEYKRLGPAVESWLMDCISLLDDYAVKWDHSVYNPDHMVYGPDENAVFERFTGEPVDVDMMLATDISRVTDTGSSVAVRETDPDDLSRIVDLNGISQQTFDDLHEVMWHPAVLADAEPGCGKYPCWAAMGNRLAWFKDTEWEDAARQLWIDWSIAGGGDGTSAEHKWDSDQLTAERTGYQAIFARARKLGVANPATDRPHGSVASVDDFEDLPPETPELPKSWPHRGGYGKAGKFVIEGFLPIGVIMVYGISSHFKSYFIISLLCRVATKTHRWAGRNIRGGAVLYIAAEGGSSVMPRVGAWADKYNDGKPVELFYTYAHPVDLSVKANVDGLIKEIKRIEMHTGEPLRIVAVDTLSQSMMQGDENSASDIAKFMAGATRIVNETGAAVIPVHHSGKDSSKGMRGSSAAFANADAVFRVERIGDAVNIINEKQRTGPVQPTRGYMVPTVPLPDDVIAANEAYDDEYTSTEGEVYDPVRLTTERVFEDVPVAEITPLLMEDDTRDRRKGTTQDWIFEQLDESGGRISREELGALWVENGGKEDTFRRTINRMAKDKDIVKTPDGFIVDAVLGVSDKEGG